MSNLRQTGVLTEQYANSHDDQYPVNVGSTGGTYKVLLAKVMGMKVRYLGSNIYMPSDIEIKNTIFACPEGKNDGEDFDGNRSYGVMGYKQTTSPYRGIIGRAQYIDHQLNFDDPSKTWRHYRHEVRRPLSDVAYTIDTYGRRVIWSTGFDETIFDASKRHNGSVNVLYLDGHVDSLKVQSDSSGGHNPIKIHDFYIYNP